jgi:hypothetical protein
VVLAPLALTCVVPLMAGCACVFPGEDCDPDAPKVTNETAGPISIHSLTSDGEVAVLNVEPSDTRTLAVGVVDGCHRGPLLAKDEEGTVLERHDGAFCAPDEWVIAAP